MKYDTHFYQSTKINQNSAQIIVPMILEWVQVKSVVDVGCGLGGWLASFKDNGVAEIKGIDGYWLDEKQLLIPPECFSRHDLSHKIIPDRKYDLSVSLEVAEHLPDEHASSFVETLTSFADVVLFSAAIPFQGGTNHVNEQWPDYWARLFEARGFQVVDCLRKKLWTMLGSLRYFPSWRPSLFSLRLH